MESALKDRFPDARDVLARVTQTAHRMMRMENCSSMVNVNADTMEVSSPPASSLMVF